MSGLFVPLDANYNEDPKILRAGALPELVHIRGLALCKRLLTDGVIEQVQLPGLTLGIPGRPLDHVSILIREGLWAEHPLGWLVVSWTKRNKTRAQVEADKAKRKAAAVKANHERWHEFKPSGSCPLCFPEASDIGSGAGSYVGSPETESEAVANGVRTSRPFHLAGSGLLPIFGAS